MLKCKCYSFVQLEVKNVLDKIASREALLFMMNHDLGKLVLLFPR
jgi:hypothetical protein